MSVGIKADPSGNSGSIAINNIDKIVFNDAGNVTATTFTGNLVGNATTADQFSSTTGSAPVYTPRAWVYFDGTRDQTGVVSTSNTNRLIRGSGNVAGVLRNGAGDYTITFTSVMQDSFYVTNGTPENSLATAPTAATLFRVYPSGQQTGSVRVMTLNWTGSPANWALGDIQGVYVSILR